MKTHTLVVAREVVLNLVDSHRELADIISGNVLKRIPKRQSAAATKRALEVRKAVIAAILEDDKR